MVSLLKEQENFLRNAILTVDHSKEVLQCFIDQHLKNKHQTFEDFLNQNQHDIYHLYYDAKCCQCGPGHLQKKKRILFASQMELLFDKNRQLSVHKTTRRSDFCCCYAQKNVTTSVLDLTLARCLILNYCINMFWYSCLTFKGVTLEQFLNSNKHVLYHLWKSNTKCCKCQPDFIFPCKAPLIMESEWKKMFSSTLPPCENDRKRPVNGAISICTFSATTSITGQQINLELQGIIIQYCCSTRKSVEKLAELRNVTFGHVKKASMSCTEFNTFMNEAGDAILDIATVCGKEEYYRQMLLDLRDKPLDTRMFCQYERVLLQTISNYEDLITENKVLKDGIDSLKDSNQEMKEHIKKLCILQREGSKRQRLIDTVFSVDYKEDKVKAANNGETLAEIDNHRKDKTYTEIKAVAACVEMLDNSKVLILSGREGSGKSKNSLEILRQMKEKHPEIDVIKLTRLTQFSDIIEKDARTIFLFDDVFGRIRKYFCEDTDEKILNTLHACIRLGNVMVIFVMRNTVKHESRSLLLSHDIFCKSIAYLDLNSEEFRLSLKEKERIFINFCTQNEIDVTHRKKSSYCDAYAISVEKIEVSIIDKPDLSCRCSADNQCKVFDSREVEEMIRSDPYQGFPQSCRIFTQRKQITMLGAPFFRFPPKSLLQEIEDMRMEGMDNIVKGLKYVILVHLLFNQAPSSIDIDVDAHKKLCNDCYNRNVGIKLHDIIYLYEELTCRYLIIKEKKINFQHRALQDSVLISFSKINPKGIIPLLSIDHMVDIVRPQYYVEKEEEIVIKIPKQNYSELAKKIISLMNSIYNDQSEQVRLMESKLITHNDLDLIYQLIVYIKNESYKLAWRLSVIFDTSYTYHFFPLYLLRNIGKLDDELLTVNHIGDRIWISLTLGDKYTSFCVNPVISLFNAFQSNYKDTIEWLLKNTDHSLLDFTKRFPNIMPDRILDYTKLLLENIKHTMIDMTQLFINVCLRTSIREKPAIDWMVDYVDNSLIDYYACIAEMLVLYQTDIVLHILEKVNHRWLNINEIVKLCCEVGCSEIVEWVLENIDNKLIDEEELINATIDSYEKVDDCDCDDNDDVCICCIGFIIILELFLLEKPGISKSFDFSRLFGTVSRKTCCCVLKLLIKHDSKLSINTYQIIEVIYKHFEEEEEEENEEHCMKIVRLIMKHYLDIDVNKIMKKAVETGLQNIVEKFLLDKVGNIHDIAHYLNITLDKLRRQQLNYSFVYFDRGRGKLLLLLLQRVNTNFIDLNSIMNDLCHISHSLAVQWLLENKPQHPFNIKNIMNKACYHGNDKLVDYLFQKYSTEDFDYKTAMIKACRNSNKQTLDVCKWLWANIDRSVFDMKAALNNASRYDKTEVIEWILTDVDQELYDTESALLCACENGEYDTVELLLDKYSIRMLDFQYAITMACRNEYNSLHITNILYKHANESNLDINTVLSDACKTCRTDIIQWIIETFDQNITVAETNDRNKNCIEYLDKNRVDLCQLISCILHMDVPPDKTENVDKTKYKLFWMILKKYNPRTIDIHKLLTESCKKDWIEIFKWILHKVSLASSTIREATNEACRNGAFSIVKWSLENIDANVIDLDNIMKESCGYGWLKCLDLMKPHFNRYKFDMLAAMCEACTYNRIHIAEWLLQNISYQRFDIRLLLQEAGRNGWVKIFVCLLQNFHFDKSDIHVETQQALENGHLEIAKVGLTKVGKEDFDFSSLSKDAYFGQNKEGVVNFLLHNIDPKSIDIATILTNACLFGWKDIVTFIVDNDLSNLCDLSLAFNTACDNGELEIVQLLLEKNDPHIFTTADKAMHSVAVKGWDEITLLLLDKVEHTRLDIGNALIEACRHGEIDVVQTIFQKVDNNMLDAKAALDKACENHMHEELVLWVLENIDQEQTDLKTVKIQALRHKWRKVQFALTKVDIENLNEVEQETETDNIIFLE